MFILINGSFGIGKTTVSKRLSNDLPRARIADPEGVGFVLRRLPPWALGLGERAADYQDMALWRRLIVVQARLAHRLARWSLSPWLSPIAIILPRLRMGWARRRLL